MKKVSIDFHGKPLSVEVGRLAKQAGGSAYIRCGETVVLVTAVATPGDREGVDFLPLTVDYFERFPAAGKIPGGFFKREGRPTEREILISRLCDRPIRPLFPDGYRRDTQVVATVFSFDKENESDVLAVLGASTALHLSDIPFQGPVAAVRVGRIDGSLIINPTIPQQERSDIDMIVAASRDAIVMVEGEADEVPENEVLDALWHAYESMKPLHDLQDELRAAMGKPKIEVAPPTQERAAIERKIRAAAGARLGEALAIREKMPRYRLLSQLRKEVEEKLAAEDPALEERTKAVGEIFGEIVGADIRKKITGTSKRVDDRAANEVRPISIEVGVLPRTHGSALFTRGETQALVTTTLGTSEDEQRIDSLLGDSTRAFMLHYNFPPFSVGEVKPMRGPGRREIGHGVLAHKSIRRMLPTKEAFPYSIRIVSDILESHGSSSMATVCGAALSLMDAGVPIKAPVAGIAMGLIKENGNVTVLSDISGDEDHIGDMDFKVAGTQKGVTGIQMDIKCSGLSRQIMQRALAQAQEGRLHILEKMRAAISAPREAISPYAPRIETIQINTDKIREVIGPGGKMIRSIVEQSKAKIDIEDSGKITIASADLAAIEKAKELIMAIAAEPEIGRTYKGTVRRIMEYGAFVEIMPGTDGLVHISELHSAQGRVHNVEDVIQEGDEIEVKIISIDHHGKIKLSQREVIAPGSVDRSRSDGGEPRGDRRPRFGDRGPGGGRGRDRGGDRGRRFGGGRPERPPRRD